MSLSVYAELGSSFQQIGGDRPAGWLVMQGERPSPEHVAGADGAWHLDAGLVVARFISALEIHYDAAAQSRRYDNRLTCTLRAGFPGPFQSEGLAFATWMDQCNAYAYGQMALVQAGERAQPTPDELVAELPVLTWP